MRKIESVEHIWCDSNDRWVYIERYDNRGTGLNFMQGDEYEEFKKNWCKVDKGLSEFYEQMKITIPIQKQSESNIGFINTVMWVYHSAVANYEINSNPKYKKSCKCK
jgi:hypothetical protein